MNFRVHEPQRQTYASAMIPSSIPLHKEIGSTTSFPITKSHSGRSSQSVHSSIHPILAKSTLHPRICTIQRVPSPGSLSLSRASMHRDNLGRSRRAREKAEPSGEEEEAPARSRREYKSRAHAYRDRAGRAMAWRTRKMTARRLRRVKVGFTDWGSTPFNIGNPFFFLQIFILHE